MEGNNKVNKRAKKPDWDFGIYFNAKKQKLIEQFEENKALLKENEDDEPVNKTLFKNVGIFVNGFTIPTASELKILMLKHGGEYFDYTNDRVTHIIASQLAASKAAALKNKLVVKPEWIVDSIKANKILDVCDYYLPILSKLNKTQNRLNEFLSKSPRTSKTIIEVDEDSNSIDSQEKEQIAQETSNKRSEAAAYSASTRGIDAKSEDFLDKFYEKSRLHLISTLATELKLFVNELRSSDYEPKKIFPICESDTERTELQKGERVVFHLDMDCFFVSVSLRDKPELQCQPVAVAHSKGTKHSNNNAKEDFSFSEIASCNYEARKYNLKNGMLVGAAKKFCPNLKIISYDFEQYKNCSKKIYELVAQYTNEIRAVSCDEMYIDFTEIVLKSNGMLSPLKIASHIRKEIRDSINCPSSIGIGSNMLVARMATKKAKPNGQVWIRSGKETHNFISPLDISSLPGVGSSIMSKLNSKWSITKCLELQAIPKGELQKLFGDKQGLKLYEFARGIDSRKFHDGENGSDKDAVVKKSVSTDVNYGIRFDTIEQVNDFLKRLSNELCDRLKRYQLKGSKLTLKLKVRDPSAPIETVKFLGMGFCMEKNVSTQIHTHTNDPEIVSNCVLSLYRQNFASVECSDLRGIGMQMDKMKSANSPKKRDIFSAARKLKEKIDLIELDNDNDEGEQKVKRDKSTEIERIKDFKMELVDYKKDFDIFQRKVNEKKISIKNCKSDDIELEAIKLIMDDWIYYTSNLLNNNLVNEHDWQIFKGYLLYLVNEKNNSDYIVVIMKMFKRLIIKNGSRHWIKVYKKIFKEVQTDFYQKYNALFNIDD